MKGSSPSEHHSADPTPQQAGAPPHAPATGTHQHGLLTESFHRLAFATSQKMGSPWAFMAAVSIIVGWALTGPLFEFGDTWQLVINTGTTIITFLMVFLIQSSQNRDARALHLKLDELIRTSKARNAFADLENATEQELDAFQEEFRQLRSQGVEGPAAARQAHERVHHRLRRSR